LGGFQRLGVNPNTRLAVLIFGLFHGFGLATKLQEISLSQEGLLANLIAFNAGVEVGQLLALLAIITLMSAWRRQSSFPRQAIVANTALMFAGYLLVGYQLSGFFLIT
ncbi:HupE/UreJ family protein, partial [Pseudomonadales bacterium]|nr:HupE/UreJ family protein [Pseudomonadales bacterium]